MATAKPAAVATSASEMPGATTAREADPRWPISWKEAMMPQTVPKSPIKGVALPVVARKASELPSLVISCASAFRTALFRLSIVASCISSVSVEGASSFLLRLRLIFCNSVKPAEKTEAAPAAVGEKGAGEQPATESAPKQQ